MAILAESQRRAVAERLAAVDAPVELELFVRDTRLIIPGRECPRCEETVQLLKEVCALSPRLALVVRDLDRESERARHLGVERTPTLVIHGRAGGRIRFVGPPMGYEFATLLEALVEAGRGDGHGAALGGPGGEDRGGTGTEGRGEPGGEAAASGGAAETQGPAEGGPGAGSSAADGVLDAHRLALLEQAEETVHLRVFFTPT
ncbi:hypothetical protein ThesuDRAFT_00675 [Thermaerobacter subterraneus DSM 13965]|nr:hypothetical protein ThesuDRAFT_00675 [Thermaerobacter subterraneus DSM 13965]